MNRKFLEQLMYFKKQAECRVDSIEEMLKDPQSLCKQCDADSGDKLSAQLSEAKTTLAYLTEILDSYWSEYGSGEAQ